MHYRALLQKAKAEGAPKQLGNTWSPSRANRTWAPTGTHRYAFQLFARNTSLALPQGKTTEEVRAKMKGRVIATAERVGTYTRG